jgi:hypothetical protein
MILVVWPSLGKAQASTRATFAIIVTNNHSPNLGRAELQYADDDGAKYWAMFRSLTTDDRIALLTDFDRDSARLFPDARAKAVSPTRANVDAAVARISAAARDASRSGSVDVYFIFAGHGDVDQGRGFLELRDGRLDSRDIEGMLKSIPSTHTHVILDSCNSFFVLNPRKPGGRRVAVTEQAAQNIGDRLPNVGVLLSTTAEAEVFEWSELQSGIFSHAVRSGLSGAADANHDGKVTYDELRAFVEIASSRVRNPMYRPKVYARGPGGRDGEAIVDLQNARARLVELDAAKEERVTLRDRDDLPWIDAHKEAGTPMTLRLPVEIAQTASMDERDPRTGAVTARHALEGNDAAPPLVLASRGPNDVLGDLFAEPFGPNALAAWDARASKEAPQVFGVSQDDADRMQLLLGEVADIERRGRMTGGAWMTTIGALTLGAATAFTIGFPASGTSTWNDATWAAYGVGVAAIYGLGLTATISGIAALAVRSDGEKLYDKYMQGMRTPGLDNAQVVAWTEERLRRLAGAYRSGRDFTLAAGIIAATLGAVMLVGGLTGPIWAKTPTFSDAGLTELTIGGAALLGAGGGAIMRGVQPTEIERIYGVWTRDPSLSRLPRRSAFTLAPTLNGLAGTF